MTKVYIVEKGCKYEGVGLVAICKDESTALEIVMDILNKDQMLSLEMKEYFKDDPDYESRDVWGNPDIWKWTKGNWEIMTIREMGVV